MNFGAFGLPKGIKPPLGANINVPAIASYSNLAIKVATNTTVAVTADSVVMKDPTSGLYLNAAISATADLSTSGAVNRLDTGAIAINQWYFIWAISNGTTHGVLASLSSTAPTMPIGYTYKARIGAVQTINGSATLYGTWQFGRRAQYVVGLAQTAVLPVMATANVGIAAWTAIALARFVPPTASAIYVSAVAAAAVTIGVAPNNSYTVGQTVTNSPPVWAAGSNGQAAPVSFLIESTNIYYELNGSGAVTCLGWDDNF